MRFSRIVLGLLLVCVCGQAMANERSFDNTARILSTPLANPVAAPEEHHFRIELGGGRWHLRDTDYSIDVTVAGLSFAYTHFFDPNWGLNLHLNAEHMTGHNSPFEFDGDGGEIGIDFVRALKSGPSPHGGMNGTSAFLGVVAWESRWKGNLHDGVFGPTGTPTIRASLTSYLIRAGLQSRLRVNPKVVLEPAGYLYFVNSSRRVEISAIGFDDDANPTAFGVALNLNAGMVDVIEPGDSLQAGFAGALTIDHNVSYQFNLAYTFGAFNPEAGE